MPARRKRGRALARLIEQCRGDVHVVVERQQIDAALGQPLADLLFCVEIVGFVAQMKARVGGKVRVQAFDRFKQPLRIVAAAQPRLP